MKRIIKNLGGILMKKRLIIFISIVMSVSLVGCGSATNSTNTSSTAVGSKQASNVKNSEILAPINGKVQAMNHRSISEYLSNFVANTVTYKSEKTEMTTYLNNYTVKAAIEDERVLNSDSKEAQIQYVVNTQGVNGPGFLDSKTLYVSNLKNVNGEWKIDSEEILKTEFKNNIFNTAYDNIAALNKKDINAYMATIDPTDPTVYSNFKNEQLDNFEKYDLTYTIESASINGTLDDKDTAVKVVENIVKNDNSNYQNNKTTIMMQMVKVQGLWKIFKIETKKTENIQ
jgi:hypothetical protein